MNKKTLDQEFAARAYNAVSSYRFGNTKSDKKAREYRSFAKSFPTLIHTCGLCQAIVYAQAKSEQSKKVLDDFVQILEPQNQTELFIESTREKKMLDYTILSRQAMRAADWLKRQASALIEGED
jgi:CRISPR-associated protein Cmr5